MSQKVKHFLWFGFGVAAAIALDQWTKSLAVLHLKDKNPLVLADGIFELLYSENRGAAFGMMQGRQVFFLLVAAVVIAAVLYVFYRMPADRRYLPLRFCLVLIASGAAGNTIDRVVQGYVVDFLYFKLINFPIFNVADCYVTVATGCLIVLMLFYYKEEELELFSLSGKKKGDTE